MNRRIVEAEKSITEYLKKKPENKKAQNLYQRICVKLSKESLDKGDEKTARSYAEKAYKVNPDNATARDIYLATKKIKKAKVTPKELEAKKLRARQQKLKRQDALRRKEKETETKVEYRTRTEYVTKELIQEVAEVPEWIWLSIAFNAVLIMGVYLVYKYKKKGNKEIFANYLRSKMHLTNFLKKDPEMVKKQLGEERAKELFKLLASKKVPDDISIKFVEAGRAFTDINPTPRLTADMVELSEFFLTDEKEIVEFLEPFLHHSNSRARANAAKAIFKYKPELALETVRQMIESEDRWEKISAVWVCSRIEGDEAMQILVSLASDIDEGVSELAKQALNELRVARVFSKKDAGKDAKKDDGKKPA